MSGSWITQGSLVRARHWNGWRRLWAGSGVLTVVLFGCGLLFGDVLGSSNFPALNATASGLKAYFLKNDD